MIEHGRGVRYTAISHDDRTMLSVGGDQTILMMGLVERRVFGHAHAHSSSIYDMDISPDDSMIASSGMDMTVRLTDATTLKEIRTLRHHDDTINSVCFSPDGRFLGTGSMDSQIKVVDLRDDYSIYLNVPGEGWTTVYCVRFSPDSKRIAFTADNAVRVWDLESRTELYAMEGHTKIVRSLSFAPKDPDRLYSGGHDRCIRAWDLTTGKEIGKLEGHNNFVLRVQTTPDGKYLVSSSSDTTVRIWNLDSLTPLSVMNGHTGYSKGLHVSQCGQYVLSGGLDKQVIVWDMKTKKRLAVLLDENIKFNCVRIRSDLKKIYAAGEGVHDIKCWLFITDDEMVAARASPLVHNFKRYIRENEPEWVGSIYAMKYLGPGFPETFVRYTKNADGGALELKIRLFNEIFFPLAISSSSSQFASNSSGLSPSIGFSFFGLRFFVYVSFFTSYLSF